MIGSEDHVIEELARLEQAGVTECMGCVFGDDGERDCTIALLTSPR